MTISVASDITAGVVVNAPANATNNLNLNYGSLSNNFNLVVKGGFIKGLPNSGSINYALYDLINLTLGSGNDTVTIKDSQLGKNDRGFDGRIQIGVKIMI